MKTFDYLISNKIGDQRIIESDLNHPVLGGAHYSWSIMAKLYKFSLDFAKRSNREIVRPEIYLSETSKKIINVSENSIHISCKPIEHIRELYGSKNIHICGWEFPNFYVKNEKSLPLPNQVYILEKSLEIWCWTEYTAQNLKKLGLQNVRVMPPILTLPQKIYSEASFKSKVVQFDTNSRQYMNINLEELLKSKSNGIWFFSLLNPFDKRKQIDKMIAEFRDFSQQYDNCFLLIKLVIDNTSTTAVNINEILEVHFKMNGISKNIYFIGDELPEDELNEVFMIAKFYLCSSSAEGLNLPLVKAMSLGLIPISTHNTAMSSYLNDQNSIEIISEEMLIHEALNSYAKVLTNFHYPPVPGAIFNGLSIAFALSDAQCEQLIISAKSNVNELFGHARFVSGIQDFENSLC